MLYHEKSGNPGWLIVAASVAASDDSFKLLFWVFSAMLSSLHNGLQKSTSLHEM
jgi:hypothetical protein